MDRTDAQLAQAARDGDAQAFGVLVERLRAPLIGYITGVLGGREDAEELAQEAFLRAWQKLEGLREPDRVAAWIYRIARNLAVSQQRRLPTERLAVEPAAQGENSQPDERLVGLLQSVAQLSEPHREVISRKHFAGYTTERIADQLGIPPGTVRSRLSRAYGELREMLVEKERE